MFLGLSVSTNPQKVNPKLLGCEGRWGRETLHSMGYSLRGISTVHLFSPSLMLPCYPAVPGAFNPELFQGSISWMCLKAGLPIDGLQFSLILSTTHNLIIIHPNVVCFPALCVAVSVSLYILCGEKQQPPSGFYFSKIL